LHFRQAAGQELAFSAARITDLNLIARMALTTRAWGAARRGFDLLTDYVKQRRQFGQPIGRFQAIQHKLANSLIGLDGARLTLANAAALHDRGSSDWRVFASAAVAFAGSTLRQIALETQHCFGAIGYSEEHEAPRHFRRVHADLARCGGVRRAREELATYLLGPRTV
jgi:alkylation response protein AidB-like acyl-CoA dehydrogenase